MVGSICCSGLVSAEHTTIATPPSVEDAVTWFRSDAGELLVAALLFPEEILHGSVTFAPLQGHSPWSSPYIKTDLWFCRVSLSKAKPKPVV